MFRKGRWFDLDNVAKIFPSTIEKADTRVFRISCELSEVIDEVYLQEVLDKAINEFPHFNCVLKKGLFWYYLEISNLKARAVKENTAPCSAIYTRGKKTLLFKLSYYKKRINLDVFHSLTDGSGAVAFLKTVVCYYIVKKYNVSSNIEAYDSSSAIEKSGDAFEHYYLENSKKEKQKPVRAYQIKGDIRENIDILVIEGIVSVSKVLEVAHRYKSTITVLMTAVYIDAILKQMSLRDKRNPIVISVPVNLRKHFASETARNFFGMIDIIFNCDDYDGSFESIIASVDKSFKKALTKENLKYNMNSNITLEHNKFIRLVPLSIKDIVVKSVSKKAKKGISSIISNVGKVEVPEDIAKYINHFGCFISTNAMQVCVCSFKDTLTLGITSAFIDTEIQMNFLRKFVELGIDVTINSNDYDADGGEN